MNVKLVPLSLVADWPWVQSHFKLSRSEHMMGILAKDADSGERYGAILMEEWTRTSVTAHIIIENPMVLRHGLLEEAFTYAFTFIGVLKMFGKVRSDNTKALKFDKHLGFTEVVRLKDAYEEGVDNVIVELHRDDCRFWKPERLKAHGG